MDPLLLDSAAPTFIWKYIYIYIYQSPGLMMTVVVLKVIGLWDIQQTEPACTSLVATCLRHRSRN